ncbi:hypothetical protein ZWY2020_025759 [Hordeum vulgare]|nr:hypothetical protein ZWY2020_025759 [Hordeum vulgare]
MEVGGDEFAVGVVISAKTTLWEESHEGVGRAERGERRNVRVLKANYIQEFSIVGKYDDPLDPAGCVLDLAAIHAREEAALSQSRVTGRRIFLGWPECHYFRSEIIMLSPIYVCFRSDLATKEPRFHKKSRHMK